MALDLNIGFYTISLDPTVSRICTIILPWGKYSCKRLPMVIAGSTDIFQSSNLINVIKYVRACLEPFGTYKD